MGLFDTFLPPIGTVCPTCGAALDNFQTKALDSALITYSIGGKLLPGEPMSIEKGWVACYTSCGDCRAWITARAIIENDTYLGLELVSAEPMTPPAVGS